MCNVIKGSFMTYLFLVVQLMSECLGSSKGDVWVNPGQERQMLIRPWTLKEHMRIISQMQSRGMSRDCSATLSGYRRSCGELWDCHRLRAMGKLTTTSIVVAKQDQFIVCATKMQPAYIRQLRDMFCFLTLLRMTYCQWPWAWWIGARTSRCEKATERKSSEWR